MTRRPNYIEHMADRIERLVPKHRLPDEDTRGLFLLYAVLALAKGPSVDRSDVHNAWAAWMTLINPSHQSIRPYETLPESVRAEDDAFVRAIRAAAANTPAPADK
jgi:hypothetical protein